MPLVDFSTLSFRPVHFAKGEWEALNVNITDLSQSMMAELVLVKPTVNPVDYPFSVVYFPWLNAYFKILPEADFVAVRTNRNKNKITAQEQAIFESKKVAIIGQSTGSQLAYLLAQERLCQTLLLVDADSISLSNLNRMRAGINQLGLPKTIVIARAIAELDPYLHVEILPDFLTHDNTSTWAPALKTADIIVDACDNIKTKLLLRFFAQKIRCAVLMETNDKGRIDIERFDLRNESILQGFFNDITIDDLGRLDARILFKKVLDFFHQTGGVSTRMSESLPEIGKSLQSYPQLASETLSGAAVLATCIRHIFLNTFTASGNFFVDLDAILVSAEHRSNENDTLG